MQIFAFAGFNIGMFWVLVVDPADPYRPLRPAWAAIMFLSCPAIVAIHIFWWLVPLLNGTLYAGIVASIMFLRQFFQPFGKEH